MRRAGFHLSFKDAAVFPRLERRCAAQRIADHLRRAILTDALPPGDRLPGQREMAAHLGVGVPTLREAIGILVAEELIECRHGVGTFVTDRRPRRLTEVVLRKASAEELSVAREVVERRAADRAARRAGRDGHGVMRTLPLAYMVMDMQVRHQGDAGAWVDMDAEFHEAICRLGGDETLLGAQVGQRILDRLRPMRTAAAHRLAPDDHLLQLHFDLAEAVSSGRAALAAAIAGRIVRREAAAVR